VKPGDRELLIDLMAHEGWPILLKQIEALHTNIQSDVLKYNLDRGLEGLAFCKARGEGSERLLVAIRALKANVRQPKD
jgi:hypothetical protein